MKARDLFEGVINNKIPTLDIVDAIEEIGDKSDGVTKKNLETLFSDFSWYLQDYVDIVLKKREANEELIEDYNREGNEKFRNAYIIQEYYEDAGLGKNQMHSIMEFIGILHTNIERIEYLNSGKATMGELIGDSYKQGIPNSFFTEVYEGYLSDSKIYSKVQELTDNFDETKLNLLCKDFDFYLFMAKEDWLGSVSDEVDQKIQEYNEQGKELPMKSDRTYRPTHVSDHFKTPEYKKIKKDEDWTEEELANLEQMDKDWQESKKKIIDVEKLIDPHGVEFFSLYKLKNLLVELKRKHTSAVYKFDDKPKGSSFNPFEKSLNSELSDTIKLFELVNSGELSKLDIHNRIQQLTDDYDEEKLNLLVDEFDEYIFVKYEKWRASYSVDDIENKVTEWQKRGNEIPMKDDEINKYHLPFVKDFFLHERYGKPISDEEFDKKLNEGIGADENKNKHNVIDENVLLGGFYIDNDSNHLRKIRDILVGLKRRHTSSVYRFDDKSDDSQVNDNNINWLETNESRKQFIEALQEQNLIKSRDSEAIIKDHFKPVREQNKEPEPIEWIYPYKNLLAYLIRELQNNRFIDCKNIWQETEPHFSIDGEIVEGLRKSEDQYANRSKTGKPSSHEIVDSIIESLSN